MESGQGNDTASVQRDRTPGRGKSSRPRGSSFSVTFTRWRVGKATTLLLFKETERPAVESPHDREACDVYEIESRRARQRHCFCSSRQTERPAVESPHNREARLFPVTVTKSTAGKATTLLLFKEVDRQNARPSKVLTTERLLFFSDDLEMKSGKDNVGLHITVPCYFILVVSLQHNNNDKQHQ